MWDFIFNVVNALTQPSKNNSSNNGGAGRQNTLNNATKNNTSTSNKNTYGGAQIKTTVLLDKKEYPVYKNTDGSYYIIKDGKQQNLYGGMGLMDTLKNNYSVCVDITNDNLTAGANKLSAPTNNTNNTNTKPSIQPLPYGSNLTNGPTTNNSTNNNATTNNSTTNTTTGSNYTGGNYKTNTTNNAVMPVYEGAKKVAEKHGIDYDLDKTIADYNQRTQDYYDMLVSEQEKTRTDFLRSNNAYADRVMEEYLDSYANAAATASGRGAKAAAALITDLNNQYTNNANDLGMLQSINALESERKAELANNPYLAEQYYNQLGTYLSQVSTARYGADVNQYVKQLDAYAQRYAADRKLAADAAEAASAKYAGLANQALYNAKTKASNSTNDWDRLYNFYLNRYNGNEQLASRAVINNLGTKGGAE